MKNKFSTSLALVLCSIALTISTITYALSLYIEHVGSNFSNDSSKWADLGAYLAGVGSVIAPILSVASILFVWWQTQKSLKHQQQSNVHQEKLYFQDIANKAMDRVATVLHQEIEVNNREIYLDGSRMPNRCSVQKCIQNLSPTNLHIYVNAKFVQELTVEQKKSLDNFIASYLKKLRMEVGIYIESVRYASEILNEYEHQTNVDPVVYNALVSTLEAYTTDIRNVKKLFEFLEIRIPPKRPR